jgi:hypothetical protein
MHTILWQRLWWGLAESAYGQNLEFGFRLSIFVGAFCSNLASLAVKMFSHVIYFTKIFLVAFAISKDNAKINRINRCSTQKGSIT